MNFWDNPNSNQPKGTVPADEWEYVEEDIVQDEDSSPVGEAIKRIEQAKLYESLLKHDFFAPGSARVEIQNKVTSEIRDFLLERLNVLVGLSAPKQTAQQHNVQTVLPWNEMQISALTHVADRLIEKHAAPTPVQAQPVVQQFSGQSKNPVINVAKPQTITEPLAQQEPQKKMVRRRRTAAEIASNIPPGTKIDPLTGHPISDNGATLYPAQKISKKQKMKPMPTQSMVDSMNAQQAARNSGGIKGDSLGNKMLGLAISSAQYSNRNIVEDV